MNNELSGLLGWIERYFGKRFTMWFLGLIVFAAVVTLVAAVITTVGPALKVGVVFLLGSRLGEIIATGVYTAAVILGGACLAAGVVSHFELRTWVAQSAEIEYETRATLDETKALATKLQKMTEDVAAVCLDALAGAESVATATRDAQLLQAIAEKRATLEKFLDAVTADHIPTYGVGEGQCGQPERST